MGQPTSRVEVRESSGLDLVPSFISCVTFAKFTPLKHHSTHQNGSSPRVFLVRVLQISEQRALSSELIRLAYSGVFIES